ncbi:MAG: Gamma-glutamyltranspeptidase, partial [Alphaproteobacteria bacterium MarineAlpha8_Bin1]
MKKKINLFLFLLTILFTSSLVSNEIKNQIQPEPSSKIQTEIIKKKFKKQAVVTANDYATKIGIQILRNGGNAIDATVAIQIALGLVEPQSSGLGGGIFITFHNSSNNKVISFEGREKAPKAINENIFLDSNKKPKKFFDAAIGGASVGVPAVVKTLFEFHKLYGVLPWSDLFDPVIQLAKKGFIPPNRLKNAIKKDKFLFKINPNIIYNEVNDHPQKNFKNLEYAFTLEQIAQNYESFYRGKIAEKIVHRVNNSVNPGELSIDDLVNYKPEIQNSLCHKLKIGYKICGPNLPSSGTICIIQALTLLEEFIEGKNPAINEIL